MTQLVLRRGLVIVLLLAALTRFSAALYLGNEVSGLSGAHDEISYSMLGQRFAEGHGLTFPRPWYPWIGVDAPQSYYSATMSLYLAAIYLVFGYHPVVARLITAVLSTLVVGMIYLLARRLFGETVALVSGLIAACYAYLVFYGVTLVTETPFILSLLVAIYLAYRFVESPSIWITIALGVSLAVAVLFRMAVVFYVPFLLAWIVLQQRRRWVMALIPIVIIVLSLLPFTIRNYLMWDRVLLLESQFGHVFWNGNHPGHQGDFHPFEVFPIPEEVLSSRNDAEITNRLLRMGIENVARDPVDFLRLTVTRLREFFTFWPTADSTIQANLLRVISFGVVLPFAVAGLILNARRWRELVLVLLYLVIHTGVYAISWTMIRYRVPLDTFLIIFAAYALVSVGRFVRYRWHPVARQLE